MQVQMKTCVCTFRGWAVCGRASAVKYGFITMLPGFALYERDFTR